jgi:CRISPR-associated protein Cmr5
MKTRDQEYASDTVQKVSAVKKNLNADDRNRYGAMAHQLPILIRTAGLAQALAFLETRDSHGHKQLLKDLAATVGLPTTLVQRAREAPLEEYMHLTRQVMAALLWYKRFAQSILEIKASDVGKDANLVAAREVQTSAEEAEKR